MDLDFESSSPRRDVKVAGKVILKKMWIKLKAKFKQYDAQWADYGALCRLCVILNYVEGNREYLFYVVISPGICVNGPLRKASARPRDLCKLKPGQPCARVTRGRPVTLGRRNSYATASTVTLCMSVNINIYFIYFTPYYIDSRQIY